MGDEAFKKKTVNINIMEETNTDLQQKTENELQEEIKFLKEWNKQTSMKMYEAMRGKHLLAKQKAELEEKYTEMRLLAIRLFIFLCVSMIINVLLII